MVSQCRNEGVKSPWKFFHPLFRSKYARAHEFHFVCKSINIIFIVLGIYNSCYNHLINLFWLPSYILVMLMTHSWAVIYYRLLWMRLRKNFVNWIELKQNVSNSISSTVPPLKQSKSQFFHWNLVFMIDIKNFPKLGICTVHNFKTK